VRKGFTLVELILLVAVVAVVAAIGITGLLSSRRASNERAASSSLKTLASAEADFRGNDRDLNRIQDFWTADVAGLYGVVPVGSTEMIKLIEISTAKADFAAAGVAPLGVTGLAEVDRDAYAAPSPSRGYWFQRMLIDELGSPYQSNTGGVVDPANNLSKDSWWNHSKFAFYAFPDTYTAGRNVFILNEGNTIFKRAMNGPVKPRSAVPNPSGVQLLVGPGALVGSQPAETWPSDDPAPTRGFHGPD
jgi:prepilin-type N-terminal cleavage/methylation domain-containing protein